MAQVFADRALRATDRLVHHPRSGRIVPDIKSIELREIIFGSYRLVYRIQGDEIHVLTVHHGARPLDEERLEKNR